MAKALIFDYNGVLVNDVKLHVKAYQQVLEEAGADVSKEAIVSRLGQPTSEVVRIALRDFGINADYLELTEKKISLVNKWSKEHGVFPPNNLAVVRKLKKKYRIAIYSASLLSQMKEPPKEFFELFEEIVTGDTVLEKKLGSKPDPHALHYTAEKLGVKSAECAYVGDLPSDMIAAKRAGMKAIGLATEVCGREELKKAGADVVVNELKELLEIKL